jgi:hypothetical protein
MTTTCNGCTYHKINIAGDMCYRPKRFKSGKLIEPGPYGFSTAFETKGWDDRADGDACGENRVKLGVNDMARTLRMIEGIKGKRLTYRRSGDNATA